MAKTQIKGMLHQIGDFKQLEKSTVQELVFERPKVDEFGEKTGEVTHYAIQVWNDREYKTEDLGKRAIFNAFAYSEFYKGDSKSFWINKMNLMGKLELK